MGSLARAVLAHGGEVTGIIPKALLELGVGDTGLTELVVTDGLRDRKAIMDERGDAFVALPGGLGTLEEVLEALTLKQLGYHRKPIAVLDLHGFFDSLWAQFQRGIDEGFIKPDISEMLKDQLFLGRGWRYFTGVIDIDLAAGAVTSPTTRESRSPSGRGPQ